MGVVQERLPPDQAFGIFLATFLKRKYFKRLDHILPLNLKYLIVTYLETFLSLFRLQYEKSVELPYPPPPTLHGNFFDAFPFKSAHSRVIWFVCLYSLNCLFMLVSNLYMLSRFTNFHKVNTLKYNLNVVTSVYTPTKKPLNSRNNCHFLRITVIRCHSHALSRHHFCTVIDRTYTF